MLSQTGCGLPAGWRSSHLSDLMTGISGFRHSDPRTGSPLTAVRLGHAQSTWNPVERSQREFIPIRTRSVDPQGAIFHELTDCTFSLYMPLTSLALATVLALSAPLGDPWAAWAPSILPRLPISGSGTVTDPVTIDWRTLGGMNPQTGAVVPALRALSGQVVRIAGYVVPLDDASQEDAEFLLVPYYGACVHTPPPPPNQMVLVEMEGRRRVRLDLFEAIWLEGVLGIDLVESLYGTAGFTIKGQRVSPYVKK